MEGKRVKFKTSPPRFAASTMQNPSSYYDAPSNDDQVLREWLRSNRETNSSWDSSDSGSTLVDEDPYSAALAAAHKHTRSPLHYDWTLPDSAAAAEGYDHFASHDSDPFASRFSDDSDDQPELPEIPFVAGKLFNEVLLEEDEEGQDLWTRSPMTSIAERHMAVLGRASERILSHSRRRSSSICSDISSRSRPAPPRSILSSSSSVRTRKGLSPPSVKFKDMPTIHHEDEEEGGSELASPAPSSPVDPIPPMPLPPLPSAKNRVLQLLRRKWLTSSSESEPKKHHRRTTSAPERPTISGPFPLRDAPKPRRSDTVSSSARSVRSVRSVSSMQSVRSCTSRIQTYWGRLSGKDP